VTAVRDMVVD